MQLMNIALFIAAYTDDSSETKKQDTPSCQITDKQSSQSEVEETDSDEDA